MSHECNPIFFWFADGENGYCSNWYPSDFTVDGLLFHNMEQFKMYKRAMLFGDEASAKNILETADPETAKNLGMSAQPADEALWDANCYEIIKEGLMGKFGQNTELREQLLATGDRLMAEASPYDPINGIGLSAEDAAATPSETWPGTNLLGKALMEIRGELKKSPLS